MQYQCVRSDERGYQLTLLCAAPLLALSYHAMHALGICATCMRCSRVLNAVAGCPSVSGTQ